MVIIFISTLCRSGETGRGWRTDGWLLNIQSHVRVENPYRSSRKQSCYCWWLLNFCRYLNPYMSFLRPYITILVVWPYKENCISAPKQPNLLWNFTNTPIKCSTLFIAIAGTNNLSQHKWKRKYIAPLSIIKFSFRLIIHSGSLKNCPYNNVSHRQEFSKW